MADQEPINVHLSEDEARLIQTMRQLVDQKTPYRITIEWKDNKDIEPQKPRVTFKELDRFIALMLDDLCRISRDYGIQERRELAAGLVKYTLSHEGRAYVDITIGDRDTGPAIMQTMRGVIRTDNDLPPEDEHLDEICEWVNRKVDDFLYGPNMVEYDEATLPESRFDFKVDVYPPPPAPRAALPEPGIDLPTPQMQKLILDAYQKLSRDGAIKVPLDDLRDELLDALGGKEPPSKPILRKQVYAMVGNPETWAEIERRGLNEIIHKPPQK
jgi:hypothetical protein